MTLRRPACVPLVLAAALLLLAGCDSERIPAPVARDIDAIAKDGTLNVLLTFNSTTYFIYRGEPMGFEYELLRKFAEDNDLELEAEVLRDRSEMWAKLNRGEADVAAARLFRTEAAEKDVTFTRPLYMTRPALVQRTAPPSEVDLPSVAEEALDMGERESVNIQARRVGSPRELAGRKVHVPADSPVESVLVEISDRVSGDIEVVEVRGVSSAEPLIRRVVRGDINLTAAPEDVAKLSADYYQNITVTPQLGDPIGIVWGIRKNAPRLQQAIDGWVAKNQDLIAELHKKYFQDREGFRERVADEYLTSETGRLSRYDALFRQHAPALGWDWRLLASQAFQESKFDPDARSWAGAVGLLQLMPGTAREVGVRNSRNPEENVAGAVRYLQKLQRSWSAEIPDPEERLKFILASYNAGRGHVLDAQRLAQKNGQDSTKWENVAYWMLQKSKRSVYTDPVVRYGFVRGLEPVTYVEIILDRFSHYRQFVEPGGAGGGEAATGASG